MGDRIVAYRVSVWKAERKRPIGRPRHRWEDNIMKNLQEVCWEYMDLIELARDMDRWRAFINAVMDLREEFLD